MPPALQHLSYDVVIIGAGGAGMRAAVEAARAGLNTLVISKVPPTRSHTVAAQGGINAALGNRGTDDWRWHAYDTIRGGDWLSDQDAVNFMCERATDAIIELEHMGMAFSRQADGQIYQRAYGGQRTEFGKGDLAYRACAVADRTGHSLLHTLYSQACKAGAEFMTETIALDLLMDGDACRGVLVWQLETGELCSITAHKTILATGGFGQAWAATTSSSICTGDGNAMALRAGLPLQDMEFIQFHPTSLYGTGVLITEGARGEGAIMINGLGERFMERYAPHSKELASRDVISRAIMQELLAGRGASAKKDHVLLDLSHMDPEHIKTQLPTVLSIAKTFSGVDALKSAIPVIPAVHYTMGGITSNAASAVLNTVDGQDVTIHGLLVIGEAACNSVHGANRLGCNSLLDLVVFGKAAGERCVAEIKPGSPPQPTAAALLEKPLANLNQLQHGKGSVSARHLRREMQTIMQHYASIFRNESLLNAGLYKLDGLWHSLQHEMKATGASLLWNNNLVETVEASNLLVQARAVVVSAIVRKESRGAHWREDFPKRDDAAWLKHSLVWLDERGNLKTGSREVNMHAGVEFEPEARVY